MALATDKETDTVDASEIRIVLVVDEVAIRRINLGVGDSFAV